MEITRETTKDEEDMIRYLLGVLPDAESDRFEQLYLQDEDLFEQLSEIEDELIDDYASGALKGEDRTRFEEYFLRSSERREKTQLALALTEHAAAWKMQGQQKTSSPPAILPSSSADTREPNQPAAKLLPFQRWSRPIPAWREWAAIAAAVLITVGSVVLWLRNRELDRQLVAANSSELQLREQAAANSARLAQAETQRDAERSSSTNLKTQVQTLTEQLQTLNEQAQAVRKVVVNAFIGIEYLANNTRGTGETRTRTLTIPANAGTVRLAVEFPESRFQTFKASLSSADGNSVFPLKGSFKGRTRAAKQTATLIVPAGLLKTGEYEVIVNGVMPDGYSEPVGQYSLKIFRR